VALVIIFSTTKRIRIKQLSEVLLHYECLTVRREDWRTVGMYYVVCINYFVLSVVNRENPLVHRT